MCVWLGAGTQLATTFRHVLYTHTHWRGRWRSFQSPTLMHATICVFGWHDSAKIPTVTRHILINQSLVFLLVDCTLVVGASCTIQASHCVCTTNGHRHIYVPRRRRQIDKIERERERERVRKHLVKRRLLYAATPVTIARCCQSPNVRFFFGYSLTYICA